MKSKLFIMLTVIIALAGCQQSNVPKTIDLSESWKFSPDTNNIGDKEKWYSVDYDDSQWKIIDAGQRWENQGYPDLDGYAWYRKTVDIPADWKGKDIWIKFGGVNDAYDLFVNGRKVSSFGEANIGFAGKPSFTEVGKEIKPGESNLIAIKVNDWGNSGGLWHLPVIITTDKSETDLYKPLSSTPFEPEKEGYAIDWQDEFNGNELDTTKWKHRALGPRRAGFGTEEAVQVKDGFLNIRAYMKKGVLQVGAISTEGIKGFKYGYFECRAQLPKTTGPWAAFWIQSPLISAGEDPGKYGVEIDIFEYFKGQGGDFVSHNLHWAYGPHQQTSGSFLSKVSGIGEGFHTFAVKWTPEKYAFYVDRIKYYEYKNAISHIEESIILSFEPCGEEGLKTAVLPDTFTVDYVRVYKKK